MSRSAVMGNARRIRFTGIHKNSPADPDFRVRPLCLRMRLRGLAEGPPSFLWRNAAQKRHGAARSTPFQRLRSSITLAHPSGLLAGMPPAVTDVPELPYFLHPRKNRPSRERLRDAE